jgi:predicted DNA-binding transcriptional regulator AlpA
MAPFTTADPLLTPPKAAEFLGVSNSSLERWRSNGSGPIFTKIGRRCAYRLSDLEAWLSQQRRSHTAADAPPPAA